MATPRPSSNASNPAERVDAVTATGFGHAAPDETVSPNPEPPVDAAARCDFLAPAQQPDEIGRLGQFRVLGLLGAGGMGMVFRAADSQLGRQVALKVILPQHAARPQARQRFFREARAIAAIDHVHVVPIFHVGEDHGVPYLVMPLLKGESLAHALKRTPQLPVRELVRIGREMAEGLAAAHGEHLVHRDVKPGNVWLEGEGRRVRLLDFGLARPDEATNAPEEPLTASGQFVGTPVYMSPEQARGEHVTAASDLFSLGVALYQMATGVIPFAAPTMMAVLTALATRNPDPPTRHVPDLPPALNTLIVQLMAKDAAQRPPSALAVVEMLRQIEAALPPVMPSITQPITSGPIAAAVTMTAEAPRTPRRRRVLIGFIVGLVVLLGGGFLAQQNIRVATPKGTLVINADDPNIEIVVKKNGAIIRDKTRDREIVLEVGDYTIELSEKKDGLKLSTDRFSITRDGAETVKVWFEKANDFALTPDQSDPHRQAALLVLKHEGSDVSVETHDGVRHGIRKAADLPKEPFKCQHVHLASPSWDDTAFRRLVPLLRKIELDQIYIDSPSVITDDGLKELLEIPSLKGVLLSGCSGFTDAGIRRLVALPRLQGVELAYVPVTDKTAQMFLDRGTIARFSLSHTGTTASWLPSLSKNPEFNSIRLEGIPLTDDDLRAMSKLKLASVAIESKEVTNAGFRHLEALTDLRLLGVYKCPKVDDGVLDEPIKFAALTRLEFWGVRITDAGLQRVKALSRLENLKLKDTRVTAEGVAKLRAELPKLKVEWDGDAKVDLHREVALLVLKHDGSEIFIELPDGVAQRIKKAADLPKEPFRYLGITLASPSWDDAAFLRLVPLLRDIEISDIAFDAPSTITDDALKGLLDIPSLKGIELRHLKKVTDEGIRRLTTLPRLTAVALVHVPVTDKTVQMFLDRGKMWSFWLHTTGATVSFPPALLKNEDLVHVNLWGFPLADEDLRALSRLKALRSLLIGAHNSVTNDGFRYLEEPPHFQYLRISRCAKIDDGILDQLGTIPELKHLELINLHITDTGLQRVKALPKLEVLFLADTRVTSEGVAKLRAELPKLNVVWDGDAKKPLSEPTPADFQRNVLEWVLKQEGSDARVRLNSGARAILRHGDLIPKDFEAIEHLNILLGHPDTLSAQASTWLSALPADCVVNIALLSGDWDDAALGRLITQVQGVSNLWLHLRAPAPITDQGVRQLIKLRGLRAINLADLKVSDLAVRELGKLPKLQTFYFSNVPITDTTVEALLRGGACIGLGLDHTQATESCLPAILKTTDLASLRLLGIPLRDGDLRKFAELKNLVRFDLWGPFITNEGVRLLEPLPLRELQINDCKQVDDGMFDHLAKLGQLTHLLLIDNAKVTDAGLAKVKDLPKLTQISLNRIPGITADGVRKLRAARPELTVVWDGDAKK